MKNFIYYFFATALIFIMSGCAVVGGIFKAGMAWGIILVVALIALIIFLITRVTKK